LGRLDEIQGRRVTPGEEICVIEEFLPGVGTFDQDGVVRAAMTGVTQVDILSRVVFVKPSVNLPKIPEKGEVVYGIVQVVKDEFAIVKIAGDYHGRRYPTCFTGLLHISQSTDRYVKNLYEVVRVGDVLKAKVLNNYPPYNLTIKEHRLGVVLAFCGKCGNRMARSSNDTLKCDSCGNIEKRKVSSDYGQLRVLHP